MKWRPIAEAPENLQKSAGYIQSRAGEYRIRLCQFFDFENRQHYCWVVACEAGGDGTVTHYLDQQIPDLDRDMKPEPPPMHRLSQGGFRFKP